MPGPSFSFQRTEKAVADDAVVPASVAEHVAEYVPVLLFVLIAYETLAVPPLPVVPARVVVPPLGACTRMLTGTPEANTPACATPHAMVAYTVALRFAGRVYAVWSVETATTREAAAGGAVMATVALADEVSETEAFVAVTGIA
jgi:hypothetical protein